MRRIRAISDGKFRRILAGTAAAALLAAGGAVAAGPARAATAEAIVCPVSAQLTFTPGLRHSPSQQVTETGTGSFSDCQTLGGQPSSRAGSFTVSGSGSASCRLPLRKLTQHITWADGRTSTVALGTARLDLTAFSAFYGPITAGWGKGAAENIVAQVSPDQFRACGKKAGLTSLKFTGAIEFSKI
ncbi:MAG: hypothetical protein JO345_17680 [Streptosporangiaceae bacterium]|nr:hypothetical protein [Streptosporangiaceae bacterium]